LLGILLNHRATAQNIGINDSGIPLNTKEEQAGRLVSGRLSFLFKLDSAVIRYDHILIQFSHILIPLA